MSRLEAEMQVDTPGFGEYTFALLDKGNGKAGPVCVESEMAVGW